MYYFHEWNVAGLYFTPMIKYFCIAVLIFAVLHKILSVLKILDWVWLQAWFNVSLFMCIWTAVVAVCMLPG